MSVYQEIKILKQRLVDFKKTLQDELKSAQQSESALIDVDTQSPFNYQQNHPHSHNHHGQANGSVRRSSNHSAVMQPSMDEVNFQYLKHVIMKFLTCRDVSVTESDWARFCGVEL